jgi:hypothetical protein
MRQRQSLPLLTMDFGSSYLLISLILEPCILNNACDRIDPRSYKMGL